MSTTTQARRDTPSAERELLVSPPPAVPFLQRSGTGPGRFIDGVHDTLAAGGRTLEPDVRNDMQAHFGADFSGIRVHDDARAHDSARQAEAAAYTVGEHIVFGHGRYQPDTTSGRALLAHELAHTVQQGGLQFRRLDGRALEEHAGLEAEADAAASAVLEGARPAHLTRIASPRLARAADTFAKEKGGNALKTLGLDTLGFVEAASEDVVDGKKAIGVVVGRDLHVRPKGQNDWVDKLWQQHARANQLIFKGEVSGGRIPSIKESAASDEYRGVWLSAHGFSSLAELGARLQELLPGAVTKANADEADKAAKNFAAGKLGGSQVANIDHIVEKQVGGTSIAQNMQILNAEENQISGRKLNEDIVAQAQQVLSAAGKYELVRLRYKTVKLDASPSKDAYDEIEGLLRSGKLAPKAAAPGSGGMPVMLQVGASQAQIFVERGGKGTGKNSGRSKTDIAGHPQNDAARRLISGLDLQSYHAEASASAPEHVRATVDSAKLKSAIQSSTAKGAKSEVELDAFVASSIKGGAEVRELKLGNKTKELDFVFPYLSPGKFTRLGLAADGSFEAQGTITPKLKFLKRIDVELARDAFALKGNLGPENFQPPFPGFKVTEVSLGLQLAPEFKPSGTFAFLVGPEQKPYATGSVKAGLDGLSVVLDGKLEAKNIPGVDAATGTVRFHQEQGWSGELKATTSKLPRTKKSEVIFGFRTVGGATHYYANGSIEFDVGAGKDLTIHAEWRDGHLVYRGRLLWEKPIKLVDQVELRFLYDGETLEGEGKTAITYKNLKGKLDVRYRKQGAVDAKLSGSGSLEVKTGRAEGLLELGVDPKGVISGKGQIAYAFSDKLRPTVGVILHPDGHLTLTGKIELAPIEVFPKFPREGGERDLIKVNLDFIIPGPFPGLADPMVHLGAGVRFRYGIGPGQLVNTVIEGSFDPLEENKNAKLRLTSTFAVPGHVGLTGILEAGLGIAVLGGFAAKVHGGLRIEPGFALQLITKAPIAASYENGEFAFEGRLEMQGGLVLGLAIKLYAHVEALGGTLEKDFNHELKDYKYDAGQQMTLTLAKIGYSTRTGFKAPSLDDVKIGPQNIDPVAMIRRVGESARAALAGKGQS